MRIKHHATNLLSRLKTRDEYRTPLKNGLPSLYIFLRSLAFAVTTVEPKLETIGKLINIFVPLIAKLYMLAGITDSKMVEIPTLSELITTQYTDSNCRAAFASAGKPDTRFSVDGDRMLVRVLPLDGAFQRVMPVILRPRLLNLYYYSI